MPQSQDLKTPFKFFYQPYFSLSELIYFVHLAFADPVSAQFKPDAEQVCVSVRSLETGQDNSPQNNSQCLIISEFFKLLSWSRWKKVSIKELNRDQYVGCSLDQNYKFTIVSGELLTLECRNFLRIQTCRSGPPRAVDFWQARMPQWRPLHRCAAAAAAKDQALAALPTVEALQIVTDRFSYSFFTCCYVVPNYHM